MFLTGGPNLDRLAVTCFVFLKKIFVILKDHIIWFNPATLFVPVTSLGINFQCHNVVVSFVCSVS